MNLASRIARTSIPAGCMEGRTAVIAYGANGIGRTAAKMLGKVGAKVAFPIEAHLAAQLGTHQSIRHLRLGCRTSDAERTPIAPPSGGDAACRISSRCVRPAPGHFLQAAPHMGSPVPKRRVAPCRNTD